ncbi:MAG: hypothetical protein CME64_08565 [Halobacteriovoraceae bacterium]|nr:hypothetical protein [Halobacteriovoraceae bacterium]|tara:strand:+ start:254013 stop:255599 length:1587 start_codon:yes stop_codon:yes gene_type:complete
MDKASPDFKNIIKSLPGLYLIIEPNAPKYTIVCASDAYTRQTLTKQDEIKGKGLFEVFPDNPEDKNANGESNLSASLLRVLETRSQDVLPVQRYDIRRPQNMGGGFEERYWTPTNTPVLDEEGKVSYIIHQVEDVTERVKLKQTGEELDAKLVTYNHKLSEAHAQLKESNRRKDIFLATLAHELRNPLAPIRSGVELLKMDVNIMELLPTMERQISHLEKLIDDLTESSRISRGKLNLNLQELEVSKLIEELVDSLKKTSPGELDNLELVLPEEELWIKADPVRISQVINNLINNSQKFTPNDKTIRLTISQDNGNVLLCIKDEGVGVEKENLSQIFEMFVQVDKPGMHQGLGLGLSISKMLIEMHKGTIKGESEGLDKGLEVSIELPLIEAPKEIDKNDQDAKGSNNLKILIADDNVDAAYILKLALEKFNNCVELAKNGEEALIRAKEFRPNLILMDLGMPVKDGHQAATEILEKPWGKDISIVALSGWGQEEDKERTKKLGFKGHLVKPVSLKQIQEQISNLFEV